MPTKAPTMLITLGLLALAGAGCELIDELRPPPGGGGGPGPGTPPEPPRACTLIGCHDQLTVNVEPSSGLFPAGMHVLTVEVPGQASRTCEVVFNPAPGNTAQAAKCSPGVRAIFLQKQSCTTVQRGGAVGQVCEPIPGKFEEQIAIDGTPGEVRLTQTANGTTILDQRLSPTYVDTRPNGPGCEPVCRQATGNVTAVTSAAP